jgi:hypothetical protein
LEAKLQNCLTPSLTGPEAYYFSVVTTGRNASVGCAGEWRGFQTESSTAKYTIGGGIPMKERVQIVGEDRVRLQRLYEEIGGRLEEMSQITARILGESPRDRGVVVFKYRLTSDEVPLANDRVSFEGTMITCGKKGCTTCDMDEYYCW